MTDVNIYNHDGEKIDVLTINDDLVFGYNRISKGLNCYYKGIGTIYYSHWYPEDTVLDTSKYQLVKNSDIFYIGPSVSKFSFKGKIGIFQERYQPQFTDFIGTCGVKELSIIENEDFEYKSIHVLDIVNYDTINNQYYLKVNYTCNRVSYKDNGNPQELYRLLEYMVKEGWNFGWDKNSITDISYNGLITDIADLFRDKQLKSQLGTVYSVLYSLNRLDINLYSKFVHMNRLMPIMQDMYIVLNSVELLKRFNVNIEPLLTEGDFTTIYKKIVSEYLIEGKNCGDCVLPELGDKIREGYRKQTKLQLNY